ncbi:hypothetical protein ABZ297_18735 [Nonomuraea sp. NPDC005983]|uniref:hypothetical protein n=1 Tax=Nonomuraea sp. NPDC005983 TaxID=3155595 RepID=UPI0033B6FE34
MVETPPRNRFKLRAPNSLDPIEDRVILLICVIVVGASVVGAVYNWPPTVLLPLIFVALYAILRSLLPLRGMHQTLQQTRAELTAVRRELAGPGHQCTEFRRYANNREFYSALRAAILDSAENQLDVWYVRQAPPTTLAQKEARQYFDAVLRWAKDNSSRSARRLICVNSDHMRRWAVEHYRQTRTVPNYEAHVVEWDLKADLLNMAIVDERLVFLAFSGGTNQVIRGMSMDDPEAAKYFTDYFNQHWLTSVPLRTWIDRPAHD